MINQLDDMIRDLLDERLNAPALPWTIDVAVRPPDDSWRATVNANGLPAVSVYLTEVREARDQRTSRAVRPIDSQPFLVDCHYIVSTWIPTADPAFGTPAVVEDWLLGQTIAALVDAIPFNADRIYNGVFPLGLDPFLEDLNLATDVLPVEGYPGLPDFWTGMGQGNTWHPSAHLVVTFPIVRSERPVGPPVTTLAMSTAPSVGSTEVPPDEYFDVGGFVTDGGGAPVSGAWVRLITPDDRTAAAAATNETGRYRVESVPAGDYRLAAGSSLHPSIEQPIEIPARFGGTYDAVLT